MIALSSASGRAEVSSYGGQVLVAEWDGEPLLWLQSPDAEPGKAIRGGVPICFPWFGPGPEGLPQHGFARTSEWAVVSHASDRVVLALDDDAATRALWPHRFHAEIEVALGSTLDLTFTVTNPGDEAIRFTYALHSYFAVASAPDAQVHGVEGHRRDDVGGATSTQNGPVIVGSGLDAIFEDVPDRVVLWDGDRRIAVDAPGEPNAIVWNPGAEFGERWTEFVCVERGRVRDAAVTLAPGERHTASVRLGRL